MGMKVIDTKGIPIGVPLELPVDDTAGGTDSYAAPISSNVLYDHNVALLSASIHPNTTLCRAGLTTTITDTLNAFYFRIELDTEIFDLGNNFSLALWCTGTADADSGAAAIVDAAPSTNFITPMRYAKVSWHDGYGYITAVTDTTHLVIATVNGSSINVGDTYNIYHCEYTVPTTGYYLITASIGYTNLVADQVYIAAVVTSTDNGEWTLVISTAISAALVAGHRVMALGICYLTAGVLVALHGWHSAGVTTVDISGHASQILTRMDIGLLREG